MTKPGRPASTTTQKNIDRVYHMVMDDRHLTVNQIADAVAISRERIENILHQELGISKMSTQWVPRLLTPAQKHTSLVMSHANLAGTGLWHNNCPHCYFVLVLLILLFLLTSLKLHLIDYIVVYFENTLY